MARTVIAVAPNGARKTKHDHPALPISFEEIVNTAVQCSYAGASMIHLHVRDHTGAHSLSAGLYAEVVAAIRERIEGRAVIQLTTESAGRYDAEDQLRVIRRLEGSFFSVALREIFPELLSDRDIALRWQQLADGGSKFQFILYSPAEVSRFERLCDRGILPDRPHLVLFVLGKQRFAEDKTGGLRQFLSCMKRPHVWMACAFGASEHDLLVKVAESGGHVRVGFENNCVMPDRRVAADNAESVGLLRDRLLLGGLRVSDARDCARLFGL